MRLNDAGLGLLKEFEGCRLTAYRDAGGIWTIGYGHTGPDVRRSLTITQQEADALLRYDVQRFERAVDAATRGGRTTENQFSAMVCLAYNIGEGAFRRSTVLKQHQKGNYRLAEAAFMMWVKVGKRTLRGLVRRRNAERKLYGTI